jgi:hypothetical protein
MAVAMYSPETSQAVCAGGAPSATPMGMSATAIIEEFTGFKIAPRIIGAMSARSNPSSGPAARSDRGRRVGNEVTGV